MSDARERSFELLYDEAPCGYLSTTLDGTIVGANATLIRMIGLSETELVGLSLIDLLTVGSRLFYETRYLPVLQLEGEVSEVALTMLRASGRPLPVLVNSTIAAPVDGVSLVRTVVFDSTRRQDYERDLLAARRAAESSESRVRTLQYASSAFDATDTQDDWTVALVSLMARALTATACAVLLTDPAGVLVTVGGINPLEGLVADEARRPGPEAMESASVVSLSSVEAAKETYPEVAAALSRRRLEGTTVVPLVAEGRSIGVVAAFFGRERHFDEAEIEQQEALARLATQALTRIRLQQELERLASHDQLTGLANRGLILERLAHTLERAVEDRAPVSLIFLDLDGFKLVNDNLGHGVGDTVLCDVGARLQAVVRIDDVVGRFGGDEFVVVCADAGADAARTIAERIRDAIRTPLDQLSDDYPITASVGVASFVPGIGRVPLGSDLLAAADAAMYSSKKAGKDLVTVVTV